MQREILHGVPYLVDKSNKLYTWNISPTSAVCIGTYDGKRAVVDADAKERLASLVQEWRQQQQPRPRKPLPPSQPS